MLAEAQQYALSRGIADESSVARDEALDRLDPIVRALTRRRIAKLLRQAELSTSLADPVHRMRLAYLLGAGKPVPDADDEAAVREAVAATEAPKSAGRGGPWLVALVCGVVALGAGIGYGVQRARSQLRPEAAPAARLLAGDLSRFVIAVGQNDAATQLSATQALTGAEAERVLGKKVVAELSHVLRSMRALHDGKGSDPTPLLNGFRSATGGLDKALVAARLPFFIDADSATLRDWPEPVLQSYYVQRETRAKSSDSDVRVLQLWRIDNLNVRQRVLGYTRPNTPAAIVLLDQVESDLVRFTLPAAAPGGRLELVDDTTRNQGQAWVAEIEQRASNAVGAYYRQMGPLASDAARLGQLLGRRRELLRKWEAALRGQGLELSVPKRLFAPVGYTDELDLRVPRAERNEWIAIEDELHQRLASFEALRDRFVLGVERHEVQHRLDYERGLFPVPATLAGWLGLENPLDAQPGGLAARARDESSAYLAELGRGDDSPLLDLVILSNFVLDRETNNAPYTYAALSVYVALGKALGVDTDVFTGRTISRERFAKLASTLWARSPNELREGARKAFVAEFGSECPTVERQNPRENPRYRPEP